MEEGSVNAAFGAGKSFKQTDRGRGRARGRASQGASRGRAHHDRRRPESTKCRNCGGDFSHKFCPAKGKQCNYCKKFNHFAVVCRQKEKKQANLVHTCPQTNEPNSSSDESIFNITSKISKIPSVKVEILNSSVDFLIDTGASVNVISNKVFKQMLNTPKLKNPSPLIYAYGANTPLNVKGYFHTEIKHKSNRVSATFYVVENTGNNDKCLLGATTAQALNMIQFAFTSSTASIPDQFPALFDGKMGKIKNAIVKLHIDPNVQPVSQRHRRIPFHVRKDVEAELKRLEDLDVIEPVTGPTPWVSPVVVVPKKKAGVRVCIDMRMANKAISREKHPMPTAEELMADLNNSKLFSKLDLSNAYHQLELDESSRQITTFSTHVGLRRYKRLLFGVNAASEIFQKTISDLLSDIRGAKNLSDDIIIHGKDQADHDRALKETLQRLSSVGAKLNRDKCIFSVDKITFYGHVFSSCGVSADPEKVKAIVGKAAPKSPAEVRSFLGMTQYVSRYIPQYATITEPLRRLTRQDVPWSWSEKEQNSFDNLKSALSSTKVMAYFDQSKLAEVLVDASPVGVAALLSQEGKVISYASRALTDVEQRYSQTDREMLAVVYGVEHFHLYLFASDFKVITDHKPLLGIVHSQKPASARMERWRIRLMPYNFTLEYRPGKDDLNPADYMSRHPFEQPEKDNAAEAHVAYISQHSIPKAMSFDEVRKATAADRTLQKVMTAILTSRWFDDPDLNPYFRFKDEFAVYDGVVLRDHRLVIPDSLRERVIDIAHNTHQGIVKTKQLVREKVWFPGIDKMVEEMVKACIPCQASYPGHKQREPVLPTKLPSEPWSEIALDFAGPFPSGHYVLVALDEHSRYPEVEIVSSTSAKVVIPRLSAIFARQGFPTVVKTDNGPPFQGREFADFAEVCGFRHRRVTPLWPEANGGVERFMGVLNKFVRASVASNRDWKSEIDSFLMHYRATPHSSTQVSPFEALTGRKMRIGIPHIPRKEPIPVSARVGCNDIQSKAKMKEYADKKRHAKPSLLVPGSQALVKQPKSNKLTPPYNPLPYTVVEKKGSMVTVERDGHNITRNSSHFRPIKCDPSADVEEELPVGDCPSPGKENQDPFKHSAAPIPGPDPDPPHPNPTPVVPRRNPPRNAGKPQRYKD